MWQITKTAKCHKLDLIHKKNHCKHFGTQHVSLSLYVFFGCIISYVRHVLHRKLCHSFDHV